MDGQPVAGPSGSSERHQEPERQYEYVNGFKFAVDLPSIPTRPTSSVSADPPLSQPVDHAALPATASAHASAVESSLNKSNKSSAETKGKQASKAATATTANGTKVKSNKTRPKKSKAAMAAEAEEKAAREANPEVGFPPDCSQYQVTYSYSRLGRPTPKTKAKAKHLQPKAKSRSKTTPHPRCATLHRTRRFFMCSLHISLEALQSIFKVGVGKKQARVFGSARIL